MDRGKKITDLYFKSLLDISEKDEESASQLLQNEGIDPDHLVNDALRKINNYEFALTKKVASVKQHELLEKINAKIAMLMERAPERVVAIINFVIHSQVPAFRFKPLSYTSDIADIFGAIDPILLLEKLEVIERELS